MNDLQDWNRLYFYTYRDDVNGIQAITECSSSDFSLSPPDLNHFITFNATQYAHNNFGSPLTETSFQMVCTFSNGGENISGVDSSMNFTILLQQGKVYSCTELVEININILFLFPERIRLAFSSSPYLRSNISILNNTIINSGFVFTQREDLGSAMLTSSGDGLMGLTPSLIIDCTATQGDHVPYWITPDSDSNQVLPVTNNYTARYRNEY